MFIVTRLTGASALAIAACCALSPGMAAADETPECNNNVNASGTIFDGLECGVNASADGVKDVGAALLRNP